MYIRRVEKFFLLCKLQPVISLSIRRRQSNQFFTDAEWDVIDAALSEYQDHFDTDEDAEVLDNVGMKLQSLFGGV